MRRALLLLGLATLVQAAAAGGQPDGGGVRHAVPGADASLVVPAGWKTLDARSAFTSPGVQQIVKENPSLAGAFSQLAAGNSPVKLLALDPHIEGGFATNLNVVASAVPAAVTLPVLAPAVKAELSKLPNLVGTISTAVVTVPAGKAVRARYRLALVAGGVRRTVQTLQYIFLHHSRSVVFTFSTTPAEVASRTATFAAVVASIRLS